MTAALGVAWVLGAGQYDYLGDGGRLAPGTLPALAGGVMAVCGLGVMLGAFRPQAADAADPTELAPPEGEPPGDGDRTSTGPLVALLGVLTVCLVLAPMIGFDFAFAAATFVILKLIERSSLLAAVSAAVAIWAACFLLFELVLQVPLP